jgi:hypothetical protein
VEAAAAVDGSDAAPDATQGDAEASPGADGPADALPDAFASLDAPESLDARLPSDALASRDVSSHCDDNVQDGDETDVDCGGSCAPCWFAQRCLVQADCSATAPGCDAALGGCACDAVSLTCVADACVDHTKDAQETDVDCGGVECSRCAAGSSCAIDFDCTSNACDAVSSTCVASQCSDHHRDGNETATDCGGGCPGCVLGAQCYDDYDCLSAACDVVALVCITDTCVDHHQDGDETDVDCGGPTCAARCGVGQWCGSTSDCVTGRVCSGGSRGVCE